MTRMDQALLVLALATTGLAACGVAPKDRTDEGAGTEELRGMVLPRPIPKPDFTLSDTEGEPFDFRAETDGYLTLLFFGYTHCPDVCPVHMANLAAVLKGMPRTSQDRIKVVFVTVDPERDTPERVREWLDAFDPRFIGLRGDPAAVDSIMSSLMLPTAVLEEPGPDGQYLVGHPSQMIAFTADGVARVIYPFGTRQADWAYDLPRLLAVEPAIRVSRAYAAVPAAGNRTALYFTVENTGETADALLAVRTDAAGRTELHRQVTRDGLMRMEPVDAIEVPPGGQAVLAPGGHHVMLLDLERPLAAGDELRLDLVFREAGPVRVRAEVRPYAELESLLAGDAAPAGREES